jgi:hypothetical protein
MLIVYVYDVSIMNKTKTPKRTLTIRTSDAVVAYLQREADKSNTTVSRLAHWYLDRLARKAK